MTFLIILSMLVMAILSYRIARSWFFPPALYALYWSVIVLASIFVKYGNHTLSIYSLFVFLTGCILFSIGGYATIQYFGLGKIKEQVTKERKGFIQKIIIFYKIEINIIISGSV